MSKERDPRIPPLRKIERSVREPNDGDRWYDVLECGHVVAQDGWAGKKRRRCTSCKFEALKARQ